MPVHAVALPFNTSEALENLFNPYKPHFCQLLDGTFDDYLIRCNAESKSSM